MDISDFIIKYHPEYQIISVQNFHHVNLQERILINNSIEENYLKYRNSTISYNFPIHEDSTLFFSKLYEKYKELCYQIFGNFYIAPQNKTTCWCYRSNIDDSVFAWHNHLYTSTINGVYYYQVEGENDGTLFERDGKEYCHLPQQGELLIFPNDLNHTCYKTTSKTWRYSINMEIITKEPASILFK
tara:strand:- start:144 stop:701 length:558 start_codon:yes stop_codon:yes gene_type:complete